MNNSAHVSVPTHLAGEVEMASERVEDWHSAVRINQESSLVAQSIKASAYNVGDPGSIPGLGRSPIDYSPRGHKESDTTERLHEFLHELFLNLKNKNRAQ